MEKSKLLDDSAEVAKGNTSKESEIHSVYPRFQQGTSEPSPSSQPVPVSAPPLVTSEMEAPPPKPPRPVSPRTQVQLTLSEAFPTVESSVIKAVLLASRGQIEPAFEALLAMTDPSYVPEEAPPPRPSRPVEPGPRVDSRYPPEQTWDAARDAVRRTQDFSTSTPRNQLEADEMFARQLAEHYSSIERPREEGRARPPHNRRQSEEDEYREEKEHSFLDDDLPVIKENIRQGFLQTQEKVNKWVTEFKKRLDGEGTTPDNTPPPPARNAGSSSGYDTRGSYGRPRESVYDADPRVISDDFAHLELRDNTKEEVSRRPPRPIANPNLFQSSSFPSTAPRKVSFQDDSSEELYQRDPPKKSTSVADGGMPKISPAPASKWEPLKAVEPTPLDGDPFSLGDSEDERERDDTKSAGRPIEVLDTKKKP